MCAANIAFPGKLEGISLATTAGLDADEVGRRAGLYRCHIALEEEQLLPLAARLPGEAQLDAVGRAMRLRRGIKDI